MFCIADYIGYSLLPLFRFHNMPVPTLKFANAYRQWVAGLYRTATLRQRARLHDQLIDARTYPIAILFYHRVADSHLTPWTISRRNFVQHLDWLQRHFDIVTLAEAQRRVRSARNSRPTVAITFDDGYAENCDFAIPELQRRQLPATYFVATTSVSTGKPFAHDLKLNCPHTPNTVAQVKDISGAGFEIGGHTKNHVEIGGLAERREVEEEILGGIKELESWDVGPIRYFSFPFGLPGNTSQLAVDILMRAGLAGFCTAYGAWNWPGSSAYHLRRIHADPGMQTLKNWLTLDSRKLRERQVLPFIDPVWPPEESSASAEPIAAEELSTV